MKQHIKALAFIGANKGNTKLKKEMSCVVVKKTSSQWCFQISGNTSCCFSNKVLKLVDSHQKLQAYEKYKHNRFVSFIQDWKLYEHNAEWSII